MKKYFLSFLLFSTFILSTSLYAKPTREGFLGPSEGIFTVKGILKADLFSHEMAVQLEGHILTSLGSELYTFEDNTGSIIIEIKDDTWFGLTITPETKIAVKGQINFEFHEKVVLAHSVRIAP